MHLNLYQSDPAWENIPANLEILHEQLDAQPPAAGSLLALPEMFASGFSMNVEAIAEADDGAIHAALAEIARARKIWIVAGIAVRNLNGKFQNQAVVFSPEGLVATRYAKMYPFSPGGENRVITAGNSLATFDAGGFKVAPFICYDLRFPEIFRAATRLGANLFLVLANWPASRISQWITLLRARAIENQAYVAGVNRCGQDPAAIYNGQSLIVDPKGDVITTAGEIPMILSANIDLPTLQSLREKFPVLKDMR
jgi:predicted amidohydrolase